MITFAKTGKKQDNVRKETKEANQIIRKSIEKLSESSNSIDEINTEICNISNKADNLVCGADRQSDNIENIVRELDVICDFADNTLEETTKLSNNAKTTYVKVAQKREEISNTIEAFNKVCEEINNTSNITVELQNKVKAADGLIVAVNAITKQSKILSVNASIEAARAGVNGKGFGVVAEEMMKLSEQTAEVNKKVDDIIKEIGLLAENVENAMNLSLNKISDQSEKLGQSVGELNDIENSTKEYSENNSVLATKSNELNDRIYKINGMVNNISTIIKENKEATSEVTKSIKDEILHFNKLSKTIGYIEDNLIKSLQLTNSVTFSDSKTIIAGISPYAPYTIFNENGTINGMDVDILLEAFKMSNINVQLMTCTWDGSLKLLEQGLVDVIPTVGYSKERESYMYFSNEYRPSSIYAFYSLKESNVTINKYEDLYKYKIAVQNFNYNDKFRNDRKLIKDNSADIATMYNKLLKGQIDTFISNEYTANYYFKTNGFKGQVVKQKFYFEEKDSDARMAFSRKNNLDEYIDLFNKNINKMISNGIIKKIDNKYLNKK